MHKKFIFLLIMYFFIIIINPTKDYTDINSITVISSMGISYENNHYTIYYYILNNNAANNADIFYSTDASLTEAYITLEKSSNVTFDYSHIETLIITENFINRDNIFLLIEFFMNNIYFYPSMRLYITPNNILELYDITTPSDNSNYYTIFTNHKKHTNYYQNTFIDLINVYYENNYSTYFPSIILSKDTTSNIEGNNVYFNGIYYVNNKIEYLHLSYQDFPLLYFINSINNLSISIENKKLIYIKKSITKLIVMPKHAVLIMYFPKSIKDFIINHFSFMINIFYNSNIDLFNLHYKQISINNLKFIYLFL